MPIIAEDNDGTPKDDGSHLTSDAPSLCRSYLKWSQIQSPLALFLVWQSLAASRRERYRANDNARKYVAELAAPAPDVMLASGFVALAAVQQTSPTISHAQMLLWCLPSIKALRVARKMKRSTRRIALRMRSL